MEGVDRFVDRAARANGAIIAIGGHDSVVSVQLACLERRAVLLIIRRSWVRAPHTPPAVIRYIQCLVMDRFVD